MDENEKFETVTLPAALDYSSAKSVAEDLIAKRGSPIEIDANLVTRVGGLGLQVLLAAQKTWHSEGLELKIINRSDSFERDLTLLGDPLKNMYSGN